jgi:hypothetical protein
MKNRHPSAELRRWFRATSCRAGAVRGCRERRAAPGRLLRLSLFQVSVGMAMVLLNGTLNRVMVLEMGVPAWLVSLMVSLPLLFAPLRALIGFRSDTTARCWAGAACPTSGAAA